VQCFTSGNNDRHLISPADAVSTPAGVALNPAPEVVDDRVQVEDGD
jgi:hypothetical protein